jgi:hypothetical protein
MKRRSAKRRIIPRPTFAKNDVVFTWNATSAGVCLPDGDWIPDDRAGLTICDATSAAFGMHLPWDKLDVTTFSWQKCMGGEAQHGVAVFSPRARQRLREFRPDWPVPRILQLFEAGEENAAIYEGSTINTPSLLCTEDYLDALKWAAREGGIAALAARTDANFAALSDWVEKCAWIDWLAQDPAVRSQTSATLVFSGPELADKSEAERWAVSRAWARSSTGKKPPSTSSPTPRPRRACGSGAGRRSTPTMSQPSAPGWTGPMPRRWPARDAGGLPGFLRRSESHHPRRSVGRQRCLEGRRQGLRRRRLGEGQR